MQALALAHRTAVRFEGAMRRQLTLYVQRQVATASEYLVQFRPQPCPVILLLSVSQSDSLCLCVFLIVHQSVCFTISFPFPYVCPSFALSPLVFNSDTLSMNTSLGILSPLALIPPPRPPLPAYCHKQPHLHTGLRFSREGDVTEGGQ